MKISEAQRRVSRLRALSWIILIVSVVFILISALKSIAWAVEGNASVLAPLTQGLQRLVYVAYEKTQALNWVWRIAPVINQRELNSSGNYGFLFLICVGALGRLMLDSANHLSARIKRVILRVEEQGWEQALHTQQGRVTEQKPDALLINIDLERRDQWYKRPLGMILLGVAVAVLGQWVILQFGLAQ